MDAKTSSMKDTPRAGFAIDILPGLTAAAVVIPKALAYATIALLPMAVYALLGSSRLLSVSTPPIAILCAAAIGEALRTDPTLAPLTAAETILIVGASGAVGSAAVQWARHLGARVTAVCRAQHADWLAGLGAERMVDSSRQPWEIQRSRFDVLLDATGTFDWPRARNWLQPAGRFLSLAGGLTEALRAAWVALTRRERIVTGPAAEQAADVCTLMQALVNGTLTPHLDAVYPLARIRDAHRHADRGRQPGSAGKRGSVIVLP